MSDPFVTDFDQVSLQVGEGFNLISKEEYLKIPATQRVRQILDRKVQFLNEGKVVPTKAALKTLQQRKMSVIDNDTLSEVSNQAKENS